METSKLSRPSLPNNLISNSHDTKLRSSKLDSLSFEMDRGLPTPSFPLSITGFYSHVNKNTPAWSDTPDLSCSLHNERSHKLPSNLLRRRFPNLNIKPESLSPTHSIHNPMRSSREVASIPRPSDHSNTRNSDNSQKLNKGYLIPTEKHTNCKREINKYKSCSVEPFVPINPHAAKDHIYRKVHGFADTPYDVKKDLDFSEYIDKKMKWSGKPFRAGVVNKLI